MSSVITIFLEGRSSGNNIILKTTAGSLVGKGQRTMVAITAEKGRKTEGALKSAVVVFVTARFGIIPRTVTRIWRIIRSDKIVTD